MIIAAESVTQLAEVAGKVLVAGSHGGKVAAHYAAKARVRAAIFNDAGLGKDEAGVAGLAALEAIGMAAAAVDHASARIGDGEDMLARGVISRANRPALACAVVAGMRCAEAALRLCAAPMPGASLPRYSPSEGRFDLGEGIIGVDSVGMLLPEDAGKILVIGSHAALHGGRLESALSLDATFAVFNDAGGAVSRLPALEARGIPAAAVGCMSARIGDARSAWESGVLSHANRAAAAFGVVAGMCVRAAAGRFAAAQRRG